MGGQKKCSQSASSPCPGASQAAGLALEELSPCAVTWQRGSTAMAVLVLFVCTAAPGHCWAACSATRELHIDLLCWEHWLNTETEGCELVGNHWASPFLDNLVCFHKWRQRCGLGFEGSSPCRMGCRDDRLQGREAALFCVLCGRNF